MDGPLAHLLDDPQHHGFVTLASIELQQLFEMSKQLRPSLHLDIHLITQGEVSV